MDKLRAINIICNEWINNHKDNDAEYSKAFYETLIKELAVINMINVSGIDFEKSRQEFLEQLDDKEIFLIRPEDYYNMKTKSVLFDRIKIITDE